MPAKTQQKKTRGTPIDLPDWWLKAANRYATEWSLSQLAEVLSNVAHRTPPWRRETVGDFLRNEFATWELMQAFSDYFDFPPAGYVARSYEEADGMRAVARRFSSASNPEKSARKAQFDKAREHLEKKLEDQTKQLESADEGIKPRRRPRGVDRSRPPSS